MKKHALIILLMLLSASAFAQIELGVLGGMNRSRVEADSDMEFKTGYGAGLVGEWQMIPGLSLRLTSMILQKGTRQTAWGMNPAGEVTATFLDVPVMLKAAIGKKVRPYVMAGAGFGFLLKNDITMQYQGINFTGSLKPITEKVDYTFNAGLGVEMAVRNMTFFIEGVYSHGLANLQKGGSVTVSHGAHTQTLTMDEKNDEYFTRAWQLMAGMTIPL